MQHRPRRVLPWVGLATLVALVAAAAAIGSESSQPGKPSSSSTVTTRTTALSFPSAAVPPGPPESEQPPPLCQNGSQIPKGSGACRPVGIYLSAQSSEMWGWSFEVTNAYSGMYNGQYVQVYAGAAMAPDFTVDTPHGIPDEGGVRVSTDQAATYGQFLAPGTSGLLSIRSVSGAYVTLQQEDGVTIIFDLATDTYG
jgi:hypothetical protein